MKNPDTIRLFKELDNKARFVGGCVRNNILGIDITDIDIATQLRPEDTILRLESAGIRAIPTGIKHGTVTAVLNGKNYEITTLRRDIECDGRHAEVEYTDDWKEDAARRDFTFNAMSMDIDGKLYDYFGGQEDLQKGIVRFVGDAENRVREDVLRILRFFRFYAYYGKPLLNEEALKACTKFAHKIAELSGERIQAEMIKLLSCHKPREVLQIMKEIGVSKYIFPCDIKVEYLDMLDGSNPLLRLALVISGNGEEKLRELCKRWKLSNKDKLYLNNLLFSEVDFSNSKKTIRNLGKDIFKDIVLLQFALGEIDDFNKNQLIAEVETFQIPEFPVSGKDLKELGIAEGKQMGELLSVGESWWESEDYKPSKEEVLAYVSKNHR